MKQIYVTEVLLGSIGIYIHFLTFLLSSTQSFIWVRPGNLNKSLGVIQKTKPKLMQIFNMNQKPEEKGFVFPV